VWCCSICLKSLQGPLQSLYGYVDTNTLAAVTSLPGQDLYCPVPDAVYCVRGCSASYCSVACRDRDNELGHRFLCFPESPEDGNVEDPNAFMHPDHPITMLRAICELLSNHLALVFLRMVAAALARAQEEKCTLPDAWQRLGYTGFKSHEEEVNDYVISMYTRMAELVSEIVGTHCDLATVPGADSMLTPEFLKYTVDTLNVNQQLVQPVSAFDYYWKTVPEEVEGSPEMAVLNDVFTQLQANHIEKVRDALGSGLYTLHHCLNHSCEPNAFVTFTERDSTLSVFALKAIPEGEEICFDYVGFPDEEEEATQGEQASDSAEEDCHEGSGHSEFCVTKRKSQYSNSLADRQAALLNKFYFACRCPRCTRELAAQSA